jgi:hypothetical protein
MVQAISLEQVRTACAPAVFDLGNSYLYQLCREHPGHKRADEILAKLILIGRTYAASIERRKQKDQNGPKGDRFLLEKVIPEIQRNEKQIETWISDVKRNPAPAVCIDVHAKLTELFCTISDMRNRSLASKYLHFHCPGHFYIYDSKAWNSIKGMAQGKRTKVDSTTKDDAEYARFYTMCVELVAYLKQRFGVTLTPRQLDNLLVASSA